MVMKIYVETTFPENDKLTLRRGLGNEEVVFKSDLASPEEIRKAILEADIIVGNPKPAVLLGEASHLKWIQLMSTGFEYYKDVATTAAVTNLRDYYSSPCAETIIAGIMALYRGTDVCTRLKDQRKWLGHALRPQLQLLYEKKVLILGWGNIGKRVAQNLQGFNCDIQVYSRSSGQIHSPEELLQQLPGADIVIGCLPGTGETKGLFTDEMIHRMKPTALFCNVGRGNLLRNEHTLIDALHQGKIGGAVLDVTAEEPIPEDHPLWNCPNTILSQHTGGGMTTEYEGMVAFFLQNLEAFKKGLPLQNQVQLGRGY